jgi:hypothetical protein
MAHPTYKDSSGSVRSRKSTNAAGTNGDPDVFYERIEAISAGASADIGATSDAAVITDSNGSMIAFLRGIVKLIITRFPAALGQALMAASTPVVIASDQTSIPVTIPGGVTYNGPKWTRGAPTIVDSANASAAPVDLSAAPTAGQFNVIDSFFVSVGAALTVTIKCETTGAVLYTLFMAANSSESIPELTGYKLATADKKVQIQTSGAGNVFAVCQYHSEA